MDKFDLYNLDLDCIESTIYLQHIEWLSSQGVKYSKFVKIDNLYTDPREYVTIDNEQEGFDFKEYYIEVNEGWLNYNHEEIEDIFKHLKDKPIFIRSSLFNGRNIYEYLNKKQEKDYSTWLS